MRQAVERPVHLDVCHLENDVVYASNTFLCGAWAGGLFSKVDIEREQPMCEYVGKILRKDEELTSSSEYLMKVRDPTDLRRRLIIDGDPRKFSNISAYANYSVNKHANAYFVDQTKKNKEAKVMLHAKEFIPQGTEIRVDYDMGSSAHPFRDMIIQRGNYDDSKLYKDIQWTYPSRN